MEDPKHDRLLQTTIPGGVGELRYLQVEVCRDGTVVLGVEELEGGPAAGVALGEEQILKLVRILKAARRVILAQRHAAETAEDPHWKFSGECQALGEPASSEEGA